MSETEQRQRVKPGDVITITAATSQDTPFYVVGVTDFGPFGCWEGDMRTPSEQAKGAGLHVQPWCRVKFPEAPKAKPGVQYRLMDRNIFAIGSHDGRLVNETDMRPYMWEKFDPDLWKEVE